MLMYVYSLFAVNADFNTLTMMSISISDSTQLIMIKKSVFISVKFSNTVAASFNNKLVCIDFTDAVAEIFCSSFSHMTLENMNIFCLFNFDQNMSFVNLMNTVSQFFFSEDEFVFFITVKNNSAVNNTEFLSVFSVISDFYNATLFINEICSFSVNTAVFFDFAIIFSTLNIFVTNVFFDAAVLLFDCITNKASMLKNQAIDDQKATC